MEFTRQFDSKKSFSGNVVYNNAGTQTLRCTTAYDFGAKVQINGNDIYDNQASDVSAVGGGVVVAIDGYGAELHNNFLINPLTTYELAVLSAYEANKVVNATRNWWGTSLEATIKNKIYDRSDVPSKVFIRNKQMNYGSKF